MIAPMCRGTPTEGLEVILNVPPLELIIQHLAINSYNYLNLKPRYWSGRRGKTLGNILWLCSMSKPLPPQHFQDRCADNRWYQTYTTYIGDGEDITQENGILCYTDGLSRLTGSVSGLAVYEGNYPDSIYEASENTGQATVFQAKIHAIKMACDYAMQMVPAQVIILSDSQAAILALTKSNFTSCTVLTTPFKPLQGKGFTYAYNGYADTMAPQATNWRTIWPI
jgi:hypothetical protein